MFHLEWKVWHRTESCRYSCCDGNGFGLLSYSIQSELVLVLFGPAPTAILRLQSVFICISYVVLMVCDAHQNTRPVTFCVNTLALSWPRKAAPWSQRLPELTHLSYCCQTSSVCALSPMWATGVSRFLYHPQVQRMEGETWSRRKKLEERGRPRGPRWCLQMTCFVTPSTWHSRGLDPKIFGIFLNK